MASRNKVLREILCKRPPYLSGSLPVSKEDLILFYGRGSDLGKINFSGVTHEQLEHLSNYCEPAAFGLNSERVLDEEYRKAGKIDAEDFSLLFDVRESGLANVIRDQLLTGTQASGEIRVERYKLNVYGRLASSSFV
ncbi:hypothetical protein QCA50_008901 [Cerrena zonata]|uniref:Uncharacterized protein n=1 Tax=Cerrena zonata TaxID=2478898 RepID=A0AAW0GF97_9APHY